MQKENPSLLTSQRSLQASGLKEEGNISNTVLIFLLVAILEFFFEY
jgi:hypothetical protein